MNLLEKGIHKRLDDLADHVDTAPRVDHDKDAYRALWERIGMILVDRDLMDDLDIAVGNIIASTTEAAYRMGIHDGFQIRENVIGLINIKSNDILGRH